MKTSQEQKRSKQGNESRAQRKVNIEIYITPSICSLSQTQCRELSRWYLA